MEIAVQTMAGYDDTLRLARWCEANGVAALAVADHYLGGTDLESPALDQLVMLGGIARETTTLELVTLVSPLTFRHPAVHLKAAVTLDEMSGGRFSLGIGTGWMEEEHNAFGLELYPTSQGFERLEETLRYLRAATSGAGEGFEGRHYRLAGFTPLPSPSNLRLVVGGVGARRTPRLAGRYADELNLASSESPCSLRAERGRQAAEEAGRDPSDLRISAAFPAFFGADEAGYRDTIERHAQAHNADVDEIENRLAALDIPSGPPDRFREGLSRLTDAGVDRVYLQVGRGTDDAIDRLESLRSLVGG